MIRTSDSEEDDKTYTYENFFGFQYDGDLFPAEFVEQFDSSRIVNGRTWMRSEEGRKSLSIRQRRRRRTVTDHDLMEIN